MKKLCELARLAVLAATLAGSIQCTQSESAKVPDRIILIVVDTLRQDHVSAYATTATTATTVAPALTPNIDRLAAGGQLFTNAVAAYHSTTMSMAAIFTGRTPSIETGERKRPLEWNTFAACGMSRFAEPGKQDACVPDSLETLAEDMRRAGYWTLGVVSNELLYQPSGYDQGFDTWVEVGLPAPGETLNVFKASPIRTARHVNRDVLLALSQRPSDRFFLYIHYIDVHDWSLFQRSYEKSVQRFDERLGELLDELATMGLLENATIILTSDHGEMLVEKHLGLKTLRHFGNPSFEPVLKVPLIVTPPIKADANALVRSQDVRGMILKIAGIETELAPDLDFDELIISEKFYQNYRKGRWKSLWERSGDRQMLFDLVADPNEEVDLSQRRGDILLEHRKRIDELSRAMASAASLYQELSEQDRERLSVLGYIESVSDRVKDLAPKLQPGDSP
ncbi:MAG: sulfatase [Myxococcales bacterium]|nr:sulfatase [Myxococcales bacterium]